MGYYQKLCSPKATRQGKADLCPFGNEQMLLVVDLLFPEREIYALCFSNAIELRSMQINDGIRIKKQDEAA